MDRDEQMVRYMGIRDTWMNMYTRFIWAHYLMSGLAVILAVFATAPHQDSSLHHVLAAVLAIDTGFIALFGAEKKANQAQRAWRILSVEIDRFLADPTLPLEAVIAAYDRGEDIIHETQTTR